MQRLLRSMKLFLFGNLLASSFQSFQNWSIISYGYLPNKYEGSVAERSKALVLGTSLERGVGSNPTAIIHLTALLFSFRLFIMGIYQINMKVAWPINLQYTLQKCVDKSNTWGLSTSPI